MEQLKNIDKVLSILKDTGTFNNLDEDEFSLNTAESMLVEPLYDANINFEWHHGISKLVLHFYDYLPDYVIKIPFTWYADEDYPDDSHPYDLDYCEVECDIYKMAEVDGMQDLLLKEWCCGHINEYPIYIQEKAECVDDDKINFSVSNEEMEYFDEKTGELEDDYITFATEDEEWNVNVCEYYGYVRGIQMLRWIYKHLDDLHSGNVAYMSNGKPVIFDYSGC